MLLFESPTGVDIFRSPKHKTDLSIRYKNIGDFILHEILFDMNMFNQKSCEGSLPNIHTKLGHQIQ